MPVLGERFRVTAIDLPGQGDSDRPIDGYDTQTVARRVHELLEHLGVTRYCLAAHDVGAWVAFPYALMFGNEIEALTLMDARIPGITLPDMLPSAPEKAWKTWRFAFHGPGLAGNPDPGSGTAVSGMILPAEGRHPQLLRRGRDQRISLHLPRAERHVRAGLAFYRAAARSAEQNRSSHATASS